MNQTGDIKTPVTTRMFIQLQRNIEVFGMENALAMFISKFEGVEVNSIKEVIKMEFSKEEK